jgi:hypothetical protein
MNRGAKAVLKPPQSKRFARFEGASQSQERLDCGGFSTAFGSLPRMFRQGSSRIDAAP